MTGECAIENNFTQLHLIKCEDIVFGMDDHELFDCLGMYKALADDSAAALAEAAILLNTGFAEQPGGPAHKKALANYNQAFVSNAKAKHRFNVVSEFVDIVREDATEKSSGEIIDDQR